MKQRGFTLIELLVVVAIIGILAAVGVVAYSGYTSGAKIAATKANHKNVVNYIKSYGMILTLLNCIKNILNWMKCDYILL